jgi:ketosteroid isomerase-like protein
MTEEVRKAIEKANLKFGEGLRRGDAVAVAALYTDDAILLPPNSGDTIHEIGSYTLKIHPKGQNPSEDKGKYIVIWKHTASGWKLHRDIWNSNLPPQK